MKKKKRYETAAFQKKLKAILRTIGDNLHRLRQTRKESLKTVAKAVGISPGHLSKIEKGLAPRFKLGVLFELCKYFKVKASKIVVKNLGNK